VKFENLYTDEAALEELGNRLSQFRIVLNITQADLAREAGIGKRTLERLEAGESTQTQTLLRVLRVLNLFGNLEVLVPEPSVTPRQLIKEKRALPKRASKKTAPSKDGTPWKWGDER
jgi:transcriptional regulator with XRE-family HTH domain